MRALVERWTARKGLDFLDVVVSRMATRMVDALAGRLEPVVAAAAERCLMHSGRLALTPARCGVQVFADAGPEVATPVGMSCTANPEVSVTPSASASTSDALLPGPDTDPTPRGWLENDARKRRRHPGAGGGDAAVDRAPA